MNIYEVNRTYDYIKKLEEENQKLKEENMEIKLAIAEVFETIVNLLNLQ